MVHLHILENKQTQETVLKDSSAMDSNSDQPDANNTVPYSINYVSRYSWVVHKRRFSGQEV